MGGEAPPEQEAGPLRHMGALLGATCPPGGKQAAALRRRSSGGAECVLPLGNSSEE